MAVIWTRWRRDTLVAIAGDGGVERGAMDSRREHLRPAPALRRGLIAASARAILGPLAGCGGSAPTTGTAATAAGFTCPNNGTVRMGPVLRNVSPGAN